jgi:hypothetical protein
MKALYEPLLTEELHRARRALDSETPSVQLYVQEVG